MTHLCQVTEIPTRGFPELLQFYQYLPEKYPFLLSTTSQKKGNEQNTAFDILFIEPAEWLKLDHKLKLSASKQYKPHLQENFLDSFDQIFKVEKQSLKSTRKAALCNDNFPFSGGWFIFCAYELAQQIEPGLNLPLFKHTLNQNLPAAYAARIKTALILDHQQEKLFFLTEPQINHSQSYERFLLDVQAVKNNIVAKSDFFISELLEEEEETFLTAVKKVKTYIKEGDVFQVNLSRHWKSFLNHQKTFSENTTHLFQMLAKANPAPFSGIAHFSGKQGNACIISSSPERLLKVNNKQLESRPIAGTRPRSLSLEEDLKLIDELHRHPKEQAEHIMLIDLIRNDLGKVCVPGSVKVNELMINESYAHVHHIVSNVIGQLQTNISPGQVIKALFPGGTITGCPKVRCMEIIAELENQPRGAYTGSMGYINLDGSMDLNILIRTMVLESLSVKQEPEKQELSFRAGAGLVFDSIADNELQETRDKALGLVRALQ
ncbi:MAG: aminodeoxychorismate synthase component I [gamma proteobacterium symbiont of Taylorina sp.]|nr:aminodeoxychorismate synthase component I [gamma proteobacterium symbiont of Taylorina sp.]